MKEIDIILKNIKNKELLPVYFFQGDEAFYIDLAVKHFEQDVLEEDEKAFTQAKGQEVLSAGKKIADIIISESKKNK